jgi:hypothetical protein
MLPFNGAGGRSRERRAPHGAASTLSRPGATTSARERSAPGQCSRTSPRPATAAAAQAQSGTKHAERPGAGVPAGDEEHMANKAT